MVRSASSRVSNHESPDAAILRDGACAPPLDEERSYRPVLTRVHSAVARMERKRNPGLSLTQRRPRISLRSIRASVTGLDESIPFCVIRSPGTCFCTGSAQGRRLMGFMRIGRPIYTMRDHIFRCVDFPDGGLT